MENSYSAKRAIIAVLLVFVFAFSVPINIVAPRTTSADNLPLAHNDSNSAFLNTNTKPAVQTVAKEEPQIPDINAENNYKEEKAMPGGDTSLSPDDILPDTDDGFNEIEGGYTEKEGVIVVPATINNIMLDNLPSIVSKKVYTFSIDSRGAIKYVFNHTELTETNCLWYITLYEEYSTDGTEENIDYRVLNRLSYESVGTGVQSSAIGILPGNYKIEVECISGYTDVKYQLAIGFAETPYYETEPNNTLSRYTELPLNRTINGSASILPGGATDTDCYLFRVTDTGYTVLYFEHEKDTGNIKDNVAWRITLSDEKGNEYFYASSTMDKTLINSGIMGLPPGYYFVTVSSHMYSNVEYSLNVSFTKDSAIESELNETPETANPIAINTEKVGSLTSRFNTSDRDYYSFTMEKEGFVVIDFIHEAMTQENDGWNVSILAEDGRLIYSSVSNWNQAVLQTPNIGLTAGNYYIKIDSDNLYHNNIVYRLILLTVQNTNWETEPNNTPADADIITIGTPINGTMVETGVDYDRDWYSFTAAKKTDIRVNFSHITTDEKDKEGWIISLVDGEGNIIKTKTSAWDEKELSFAATVKPGKYYILIETGLHFNSNRYVLAITS